MATPPPSTRPHVRRDEPAVLLVHGAWHGSWTWDLLRPELTGVDVRTVDLPSSGPDVSALGGFDDDVAAIRDGIDAIGGPTVVVAHSYGGLPTTEAVCGRPDVIGVVYVAAFAADTGESVTALFADGPPPWWDVHPEDGYLDALDPETIFYGDVDPAVAHRCAARLGHQSLAPLSATLSDAAWRHVPTAYIVCDDDAALPAVAQQAMAARAVRVHHLASSHSPFLSMPAELAALILRECKEFTSC